MMRNICKLETFQALVDDQVAKSFAESCLGVTVEENGGGRIYRAEDKSVEVVFLPSDLSEHKMYLKDATLTTLTYF